MIVTERGDEFILITQPDHAALAGALMALWRNDGIPDHPRRQDLLLAIREHDNGWQEADAAPRIDRASGFPLEFRQISPSDRLDIWKRGVRRLAAEHPFAALLISRHAVEIHRDSWTGVGWEEFGKELAELEEELLAETRATRADIGVDYRVLELADSLSLGACGALGTLSKGTLDGYRFELQLGRIALMPFPLAGATTLTVTYRSLARESFDTDSRLAQRLATATWRRLPVHIEPLPS